MTAGARDDCAWPARKSAVVSAASRREETLVELLMDQAGRDERLREQLDAELDVALPEVLVYEPTRNGRLRLVALEHVVFKDAWNAEHGETTPQLFGRDVRRPQPAGELPRHR